ncbi:MAG: PEP-CTERM sorting domain-containing protein [Fimbriimonadaceae bacterium]|jgi:hypothetical protein|nr:PEP-CTERM sorting domain-containing protein [Fimbriimonadaceae bacterium]
MKKLLILAAVAGLSSLSFAQIYYQTSFEAPTFTTGVLAGQDSWLPTGGGFEVTSVRAKTGIQSIRNTAPGEFAWRGFGAQTGTIVAYSSMWIEAGSSADVIQGFELWNAAGTLRAAGVWVRGDGLIRGGQGSGWNTTNNVTLGNLTNATGRWIDMALRYTTGTNTATAWVDGTEYNFNVATARTEVGELDFYHDWISTSSSTGTVYFDDVKVVPEPMTMAVLALGALAARRRKNRKS